LSETYIDWLNAAEENLDAAKILFQYGKYRLAIFNLQQAGEIISKAIMMRVNLLITSEENELVKEIRKNMNIPAKSAVGYGHNWQYKLLDVADGFIDNLGDLSGYLISSRIPERRITDDLSEFQNNIPDYKKRIKVARTIKADFNPKIEELNEAILFCHKRLDISFKVARKFKDKSIKNKMPDKKHFIKNTEKALEIRMDKDSLNIVDKVFSINIDEYAQRLTVFSQTLIILAIVNSYLLPHEQRSRYPQGQPSFPYNCQMPLVRRIDEFRGILNRCLMIGRGQQGLYRD